MTKPQDLRLRFGRAPLPILLLLSGCAVGPDFAAPEPPRAQDYTAERLSATASAAARGGGAQSFVKEQDIPGAWWTLFHSKPLNRLIEAALANNHDLKAAEAGLKAAQEAVEAQKGFFYPTVTGTPSGYRQAQAQAISPTLSAPPPSNVFNLYTPQVNVSYSPDVWGLNRRNVESLQAQTDMQRFQTEATYLTLTSNIVVGAVQEASYRGQIDATKKAIATMRDLLGIIRKEKALGQTAEADVALQEAALAQAEAALPVLEKQLAQQRDLLTALIGGLPSQPPSETFELSGLHLPEKLPVSVPAALIWQRPDVRAAEENMHSALALVGVALANRLPQVEITGNAGATASVLSQLFTPGNYFWQFGGQITQTFFDGGTLMHRQAAAEATAVQAAEQYKGSVINALQNVADALRAIQHDADNLKVAAAAEAAAAKSLTIAQGQRKLGMVSTVAVLLAQQTYLNAVVTRVQAQALRYADTAALFQALGGGWWNRPHELDRVETVAKAKIFDFDLYPGQQQIKSEDYAPAPAK